ncbi:MAG: hypothetical protein IPM07_26940 [Anaerolineales bacterium]|nr:hypothetical protein [Anaerolineales bacterium]
MNPPTEPADAASIDVALVRLHARLATPTIARTPTIAPTPPSPPTDTVAPPP